MTEQAVLTDVKDGVLVATFNRPERMNTLSPELSAQLTAALEFASTSNDVRAVLITGAGTDGMISISPPKAMEHVDGQLGDAVGFKTGMKTATGELSVLQSALINVDLLGVVNAMRTDTTTNGQGAFYMEDLNTGQICQGDVTIDGYPNQIQQNAEETNYVYALRIYNFEMTA